MKICALITSQAFSLYNFRGPLIQELISSGIAVYAFAPDFDNESRAKMLELGAIPVPYQMSRAGMNPLSDGFAAFSLMLALRRLRPDITLGYFIKPVIYGTLAAWVAGVRHRVVMIEGLGYVFTTSSNRVTAKRRLLKFIVSLLYKFSLSQAHKVIVLNQDDMKELISSRLVDENKVINIGGIGVDLAQWPKVPIHIEPVTFLLAARLLKEKGIIEYANAARLVKLKKPKTRFILLGALDPNPGGLKQSEIEAWVKEGLIEWPGHVPVKPWLAQTSVFVLPSYREGLPRSTQEAMAMGRPVITTDAPGCRDTVQNGVNGFLVPVRNVPALAEAMFRFIENLSLIKIMGNQSRHFAEENFDVHKINARLMKILEV
jgi:glycosyltransferase involved in cell wall biosynthesis